MTNLIAVFIALCMMLSGGYASDISDAASARAYSLSGAWVKLGNETVHMKDLEAYLGLQAGGESGLIDFGIYRGESLLLPIQLKADYESGLALTLCKTGRSYIIRDLSILENLLETDGLDPDFTPEDAAGIAEGGKVLSVLNAQSLSNGLRLFLNSYMQALSETGRCDPVPETIERDGKTIEVNAYRYSISPEQEWQVAEAAVSALRDSGKYSVLADLMQMENTEQDGLDIIEYISPDGAFHELQESFEGEEFETVRITGDEARLIFDGILEYDDYKEEIAFDMTCADDRLYGYISSAQTPEAVYESAGIDFNLVMNPETGDVTGTINLSFVYSAFGGEIRISLNFKDGGALEFAFEMHDIAFGGAMDISAAPIEDKSLSAKRIAVDDESDILSLGLGFANMGLDVSILMKDESIQALSDLYMKWLDSAYGEDENAFPIYVNGDTILRLNLSENAKEVSLPRLADAQLPDGYELASRNANLSLGTAMFVLESESGVIVISYADNPDTKQALDMFPRLMEGPCTFRVNKTTFHTAVKDTRILNIWGGDMDDETIKALSDAMGF